MLGGGQLGRMMAMAAARLGYRTVVLDPDGHAPAALVSAGHVCAPFDDFSALDRLATQCAVVTYEWENVPVETVRHLASRVPVHPPVAALEAAQDRVREKTFLNSLGVPTAAFRVVNGDAELADALAAFSGEGILKTRRGGYDGKGQRRFRACENPAGAFAAMGGAPLVLEAVVPFEREVSVIAARGQDGAFAAYEPAENTHENGILRRSTVPASISPQTASAARDAARHILDALDYVGVIGVEFFALPDGGLLANEIAPRVHNSGHWTEAACAVSQFEQHVRAVCGLALGSTRRFADCAMENLLGDEVLSAPELLAEPDAVLHLYGKAEARPGRKMGHVTRLLGLGRGARG
jgi:5-(carboxyamino)imidazole ribonucleotide synthase